MATRKPKSSKRGVVHRAHSPNRATPRRHTSRKRGAKRRVYASHRRTRPNPVHHRRRHTRRRYHSNPLAGAGGEILNYTVAGLAQGMAAPIVGGFVGRFLPFGAFNAPILTAGTGWLLSKAFGMFGPTRRFAHASLVFGFAAAAMQVLQPIVARTIGGGAPAANPTMSGWGGAQYSNYQRSPMRGIGVTTGIPPVIMPPPPAPANSMMSGVGMQPGVYGFAPYGRR